MSNSSSIGRWRRVATALLLGGALVVPLPAAAAKPYVEEAPSRGFHLFLRPKKAAPDAQWEYVQALERDGRDRAAAKQALALRIFWPNSPEAPRGQLLYARHLDRRGKLQTAFDAYQHLVDHYAGRFDFNEVVARQMQIAKKTMEQRKGKFLFLPGFDAPERAIPMFEKIVASAPEGEHAAEAYYLIGVANERIYEYNLAIDAYFNALNRFPQSPFAEKAAFAQANCHIRISDDSPNDARALDTASAACTLFLQRYPDSDRRGEIEASRDRLRGKREAAAFARARYYDRILLKPASALIEYRTFVALFPDAPQAPEARLRIEQLQAAETPQEN